MPLFIRAVRSTRLSPEGERFLSAVRPALTDIGAAVGALRRRALTRVLRVSTVPSVAHEMLIPHLHTFSQGDPNRSLHVETAMELQDARLRRGEVDAAIRMGLGRWPHFESMKIGDIEASPVCNLGDAPALRSLRDLRDHTLIAVRGHEERTWKLIAARGGLDLDQMPMRVFETYFETLRAAEAGLGVGLGLFPLVHSWLKGGRLAAPIALRWPSPASLFLVIRPEDREDPVIVGLWSWLKELYQGL